MVGPKKAKVPHIPRWVYTLFWIFWILSFGVFETLALMDERSGDTLSEHVWYLTSSPVLKLMFAGFLLWLLLHLFRIDKYIR